MMQNRTDETPSARMAVARADLEGWNGDEAEQTRIAANVCTTIKNGLPFSDLIQITNIDCFFAEGSCTVTVQAMARGSVAWAARLGAGVAFSELGDATVTLVQEN